MIVKDHNPKYKDATFFLDGVATRLYVYDDKVVIEHHGVLGFLIQGLSGRKTIPTTSIKSVQFREGGSWVNGFIQFGIAGGIEKQGGVLNAAEDENSVMFYKDKNEEALEIKNFIESKINHPTSEKPLDNNFSVADEIFKLKNLMSKGVISDAEFEQQKQKLLQ
jgi:hypothetical protein